MKESRQWRWRNGEVRAQQWGAARRRAVAEVQSVPCTEFGHVETGEEWPVAWFMGPDGQTMEVLEDGTTRPSIWRTW